MFDRLAELREKRENGEGGFTLIELLVVVVIIGILIAIAVPLYLNYRRGANDKSAQSDLRGAVSALEQCNSDSNAYPAAGTSGIGWANTCAAAKLSEGTTLTYAVGGTPSGSAFTAYTKNSNGTKTYCYSSAAGGSVSESGAATATYNAACAAKT